MFYSVSTTSNTYTPIPDIFAFMIVLSVAAFLWFIFGIVVRYFVETSQNAKLLKTGIPARARVLQIWKTGIYAGDKPQIGFLLEVQLAGCTPYLAKAKAIVKITEESKFQPGALLDVRLDPQQSERVAIKGVAAMFTTVGQMLF